MAMGGRGRLASKEERLAIADSIREFLNTSGSSRKVLIGHERHNLSESTVNKVFQGEFSERTLTMIETLLGTSFRQKEEETQKATKDVGGYTRDSVEPIIGDYLCVRPLFANPTHFNAYLITIEWSTSLKLLTFKERSRADSKYAQQGTVYVPFGIPFMHLLSANQGNVRLITLSQPDEGVSRGIVCTLSNPKGAIYIPVSAPIVLHRLADRQTPSLGIIAPDHPSYDEYQQTLSAVTAEEYGVFALNQNPSERRRGMSVVNS